MYYRAIYNSPLGPITLVFSGTALAALILPGQPEFRHGAVILSDPSGHPLCAQVCRWLDRYFAGEHPAPAELLLAPEGTPFRRLIWSLLLKIPYGQTVSYGALAREAARLLGKERMSAQAVGGAVGANPISIIIPCHRVLGSGGTLTGYAGGLDLKKALLELEGIGWRE